VASDAGIGSSARFDIGPRGVIAMQLTAVLTPAEEGGFVALNPETGTTTQGESIEEAIANLQEATALYLQEFALPARGHPLVTMFSAAEPADA
jgi:predicted RNase H-like HicB family nuclease